jgi:hypothetical protein
MLSFRSVSVFAVRGMVIPFSWHVPYHGAVFDVTVE